ncbi:uncharacterized protein FIBRA_07093 [Fibroporia radiculosa]|uniref:DUF221-domain-containing protein n=1 Tax=Fibroporia radiculosa TaxID=599839 RepID=J4I057_9APHY|nr:uncharacterized protein FIBRA_07093 [Fibroporia radiculosa]CCM04897.1 predicted protein [Fibroporia radiculosa]
MSLVAGKRAQPLSDSIFLWPWAVYKADYHKIKDVNGLDAYFFVRFLRMMLRVLIPIWLISWVILLPVDSVGTTSGTSDSLTQFQFGNIGPGQQDRHWAHLVLVWAFTIWIWWNIRHEMSHFVTTRQRWLIDPENATAQANTMLVTGVPQRYLTEAAIKDVFSYLPGGVAKVWLNRDLKDMPDLYERRLEACKILESAETSLLNTAIKLHNKRIKKEAKAAKKSGKIVATADEQRLTDGSIIDTERGDALSLAERLVPQKKRPTRRLPLLSFLPSLPLIGTQVDSIEWAREEIAVTGAALRSGRRTLAREVERMSTSRDSRDSETGSADGHGHVSDHGHAGEDAEAVKPNPETSLTYPPLNSAFVLFNEQIAAHMAAQALTHHSPYRMAHKYLHVAPADIIWGNLNMNPYEMKIRTAISWCLTVGLIIVWAFPVAFIGAVSNIHSLCSTYGWLAWVCGLPPVIVGIISGILPPALLAILMMLLPIVLRLMARFEGMPTRSSVELSLMTRYFLFQVIHSFLIVTLSSGIIAALPQLVEDTNSIPSMLASNLPKASTFFLTYIILQGLSGSASGFLDIISLAIYYVKLYLMGSTPRSIYNIKYSLNSVQWGTAFPSVTLLVVITVAYSIISPIINGLAVATFFLLYQLWKYRFLWQLGQPRADETGGMFFPKAIQHVFVGLYLQLVCLAALFFLAQNGSKKPSAVPEGALTIVLIAFTAFFHIIINNSYGPLIDYLPLTLAGQDLELKDSNRAVTEQVLRENASATSLDAEQQEKRQGEGQQVRSRRESSHPGKARVDTKEYATRESDEIADATGDVDVEQGVIQAASEDDLLGVDEEDGPKDFYHPATVEPQMTIWIPKDPLGLGEAEENVNREKGIAASTENARMDGKGHVDVLGAPPEDGSR